MIFACIQSLVFWHELRRCSRSPFRLPTGNNFSGPLFSPFFFFLFLFSYYAEVVRNAHEPRVGTLSRPHQPFRGPLVAISGFAGGVALQVVSECPLHR